MPSPLGRWPSLLPGKVAIDSPQGRRTFGELEANSSRLANALLARGLKPGDSVVLLCSNRPEFVEAMHASERAGLRATPVPVDLTAREAGYIIRDCEARAAIIEPSRVDPDVVEIVRDLHPAKAKLAIGGDLPGTEDYGAVVREAAPMVVDPGVTGASMYYTSGTTGEPKGVVHRQFPLTLVSRLKQAIRLEAGRDLALAPLPLYRSGVFGLSIKLPLAFGVGVVLVEETDAEAIVSLIARRRISHVYLASFLVQRMAQLPEATRRAYDLTCVRTLLHGGAPCSPVLKRRLIDWLGPVITECYAGTEGGGLVISSEEWLRKPGSVGRAGGDIAILDDRGEPLPPRAEGNVYLKSPENGRFEYFKEPEKTRRAYRGDFFTMGDVGYLDEDRYLFLTGRSAEIVNIGGLKVYPAELDAVLLGHPAVAEAACIGVPNADLGEELKALIQLRPGLAPSVELSEALAAHCRGLLAPYKCPATYEFVAALPRHPNGKIRRHELRAGYGGSGV